MQSTLTHGWTILLKNWIQPKWWSLREMVFTSNWPLSNDLGEEQGKKGNKKILAVTRGRQWPRKRGASYLSKTTIISVLPGLSRPWKERGQGFPVSECKEGKTHSRTLSQTALPRHKRSRKAMRVARITSISRLSWKTGISTYCGRTVQVFNCV